MTQDYQGQNFIALAIGPSQPMDTIKSRARQFPGLVILNDSVSTAWNLYGQGGFPTNYAVDGYDTVRYATAGWNPNGSTEAVVRPIIERYLTGISETHAQPLEFTRLGANPVVGQSAVRFSLSKAANVTLRVYSTSGALVRTLVNGQMSAGANTVNWDLRDNAGRTVGNGLYLYELNSGSQVAQAEVSVLK